MPILNAIMVPHPPLIIPRVLVAAVPWRWLARNALIVWCSAASWTRPSNSYSGS